MLELLQPVMERWAQPVHSALYFDDEAAARGNLEAAEGAITHGFHEQAEREALGIYLRLLRFAVEDHYPENQPRTDERHSESAVLSALEDLQQYLPETPAGTVMRARALFHVRCIADRAGLRELSQAEGEALLAAIPEVDRDNTFWSLFAYWAFRHRLADHLFAAYSEFLTHRKHTLSPYSWDRLRLMQLLMTGEASYLDVEILVERLPNLMQATIFSRFIQPRCLEDGRWDSNLQMMFDLKLKDLTYAEDRLRKAQRERRAV